MKQSGYVIITLALSAFVISCSSGSSSQSASPRKAAKRLGESSAPAATSGESATPAPRPEAVDSKPAPSSAAVEQTLRTLYINVASANVRSMPSKEATIVAKMKFLDPVGATGMLDGEWVQVEVTMPDGAIGKAWIHSTLVSASKEQAEAVKAAAGGK
jgi:hypothetical protein